MYMYIYIYIYISTILLSISVELRASVCPVYIHLHVLHNLLPNQINVVHVFSRYFMIFRAIKFRQ